MLNRIQWKDEEVEEEQADSSNYCKLVWTGIAASKVFKGKFKILDVQSGVAGRKVLDDHGVPQYWDLCASATEE